MPFKGNRIVIYFALQIVVALLYFLGNLIRLFDANTIPLTSIDNFITPHFFAVWVYMSFFLLLFLAVYLPEKKDMLLFIKMVLINSTIAMFIFIFYPTFINDNAYLVLQKDSPITFKLMTLITNVDVRSNCFPSLHIAHSLLAVLFLFKLKNKPLTIGSIVWFLLIMWSVLSTGQHYFYDILGGILLSTITYYGTTKFFHNKKVIN